MRNFWGQLLKNIPVGNVWEFGKLIHEPGMERVKMYSTGWAKSRRAFDCFLTIMAEISGRYWQILDSSGKRIIQLSSLAYTYDI